MTLKHATASVFLFTRSDDGWRIGLIRHPRFGRWMLPGGHVEADENPSETALREVREETGLTAALVAPPTSLLPTGFPDLVVPAPFWIVEERIPGDRLPEPHVHIDFLYVAVVPAGKPIAQASGATLAFWWCAAAELAEMEMFPGTRLLATALLPRLDTLTGLISPQAAVSS